MFGEFILLCQSPQRLFGFTDLILKLFRFLRRIGWSLRKLRSVGDFTDFVLKFIGHLFGCVETIQGGRQIGQHGLRFVLNSLLTNGSRFIGNLKMNLARFGSLRSAIFIGPNVSDRQPEGQLVSGRDFLLIQIDGQFASELWQRFVRNVFDRRRFAVYLRDQLQGATAEVIEGVIGDVDAAI